MKIFFLSKRQKACAPWGDRTLDHQLKRLALYRWANEACYINDEFYIYKKYFHFLIIFMFNIKLNFFLNFSFLSFDALFPSKYLELSLNKNNYSNLKNYNMKF